MYMYKSFKKSTSLLTLIAFIMAVCLVFPTGTVFADESEPTERDPDLLAYDDFSDIPAGTTVTGSNKSNYPSGYGFRNGNVFYLGGGDPPFDILDSSQMKYPFLSSTPNYLKIPVGVNGSIGKNFDMGSKGTWEGSTDGPFAEYIQKFPNRAGNDEWRIGKPGETMWLSVLMDPGPNSNYLFRLVDDMSSWDGQNSIVFGIFKEGRRQDNLEGKWPQTGINQISSDGYWGIHVPRLYEGASAMNEEVVPTVNMDYLNGAPAGAWGDGWNAPLTPEQLEVWKTTQFEEFPGNWNPGDLNPVITNTRAEDGEPTLVVLKITFGEPQGYTKGDPGKNGRLGEFRDDLAVLANHDIDIDSPLVAKLAETRIQKLVNDTVNLIMKHDTKRLITILKKGIDINDPNLDVAELLKEGGALHGWESWEQWKNPNYGFTDKGVDDWVQYGWNGWENWDGWEYYKDYDGWKQWDTGGVVDGWDWADWKNWNQWQDWRFENNPYNPTSPLAPVIEAKRAEYIKFVEDNLKDALILKAEEAVVDEFHAATPKVEAGKENPSTVQMFINPDLTLGEPATPDAEISTILDISFGAYGFQGASGQRLDEVRVGKTFESVTPLSTYKLPITKVKLAPVDKNIANLEGEIILSDAATSSPDGSLTIDIPTGLTASDLDEDGYYTLEPDELKNNKTIYRFARYQNNNYAQIAELEFYSGNVKLSGTEYGSPHASGNEPQKAFDNDITSYYKAADDPGGGSPTAVYIGIDLGEDDFCAMPEAFPLPGRYDDVEYIDIELTTDTAVAEIWYTLDGPFPKKNDGISTKYETPIRINKDETKILRAVAVADGRDDSNYFIGGYGVNKPAPKVQDIKSYHLGNSLTDTLDYGQLQQVAISAGFNYRFNKQTTPGTPTKRLLDNQPGAFGVSWLANNGIHGTDILAPLDVITAQPFVDNSGRGPTEIMAEKEVYDIARRYNPNIRFIVYGQWPDREVFEEKMDWYIKEYEYICRSLDDEYSNDDEVNIIPNMQGLIILKEMIERGEYPGDIDFDLKGRSNFYEYTFDDGIHLSTPAAYLVSLTSFATIYQQDPTGIVKYKPDTVTEEQAKVLQQIAWKACTSYKYSGVYEGGTFVEPQAFDVQELGLMSTETRTVDGHFVVDGDGVLVGYTGPGGDIVIPQNVNITAIGNSVFRNRRDIKSVVIPDGVTSIGKYAFEYCVESIKTPDDGEKLSGLASVTIPSSVKEIGDYAFYHCTALETIIGADSVETIGRYSFANNYMLETVPFTSTVKSIGESAFNDCRKLTAIDISGITSISNSMLSTTNITSIDLTNITSIGNNALSGSKLTTVTIPANVKSIGIGAFASLSNLASVTIESGGITLISDYIFADCNNLDAIVIPEGITSIGDYAFWSHNKSSKLAKVEIPASLTTIGKHAFMNCDNLEEIKVNTSNTAFTSDSSVLFNKSKTTLIKYPANKSEESYEIPATVTEIADYAFHNNKNLTSMTIPSTVKTIGNFAFAQNYVGSGTDRFLSKSKLQTIEVKNGTTSIGKGAFQNCEALKTVIMANSVESVGDYTFDNCRNLESITLSDNLTEISDYMFRNSLKIESVTIPNCVTSIGNFAFGAQRRIAGGSSSIPTYENISQTLAAITIPSAVKFISPTAFALCPQGLTITGASGSYAEEYAANHDIDFSGTLVENLGFVYDISAALDSEGVKLSFKTERAIADDELLLTVLYDDKDNMLDCKEIKSTENQTEFNDICFDTLGSNVGYVRIFVWDSFEGLEPIYKEGNSKISITATP